MAAIITIIYPTLDYKPTYTQNKEIAFIAVTATVLSKAHRARGVGSVIRLAWR